MVFHLEKFDLERYATERLEEVHEGFDVGGHLHGEQVLLLNYLQAVDDRPDVLEEDSKQNEQKTGACQNANRDASYDRANLVDVERVI